MDVKIAEKQKYWLLSYAVGGLSVEYKIPKDICATMEELQKYAKEELLIK